MYFVHSSFDRLTLEIRAQQIGAFTRIAPSAPVFDELPLEPRLTVLVTHRHLEQVSDAGVGGLQPPQHALDLQTVLQSTGGDSSFQSAQAVFEPRREPPPNRELFLAPRGRSTQHVGFGAARDWQKLRFDLVADLRPGSFQQCSLDVSQRRTSQRR
jgi:hypothetical protein